VILVVIAAMAASTLAGLLAHRRAPQAAQRGATLSLSALFWVLGPFVIVCSLPRLHVGGAVAGGIAIAYVTAAVTGTVAWLVGARVLRLPRHCTGTLVCATVLVNTGYFGLPFISAVLGPHALPAAIAYDSLVSGPLFYVAGFAIGALFGKRGELAASTRMRQALLRNPPLIAAIAGLLLPGSAVPDALVNAAHHAVWGLLVLGFFALGVTLASEARHGALAFPPRIDAQVATVLLLRLALAPAIYLTLSAAIGGTPAAFRLDAAMPVGINTLVVAHATGLDLRIAASAIAWSTAIVAAVGLVAAAV
jgi:predicted permease